jgi:hypothetical protein
LIRQNIESGELRVEPLQEGYAGFSLCYIDQYFLDKLFLSPGNFIEIKGKKKTGGIVRFSIRDNGRNIIRLDSLQRLNAGVKVGEFVKIRKIEVPIAKKVELTPIFAHIDLTNYCQTIKLKLIGKPLVNGDLIDILGKSYQNDDPSNQINQIQNLFREPPNINNNSGLMRLIVDNTTPSNEIVRVTKDTRFKINNWVVRLDEFGNIRSHNDFNNTSKNYNREIVEDLLSYTRELEKRIHNIEIEKKLIHLEHQRLDYGKRILNNAIERLTNITDKLMATRLVDSINAEIQTEEDSPDVLNSIIKLENNLKELENYVPGKGNEKREQKPRYCRYCGEKLDREEKLIFCPHCGVSLK